MHGSQLLLDRFAGGDLVGVLLRRLFRQLLGALDVLVVPVLVAGDGAPGLPGLPGLPALVLVVGVLDKVGTYGMLPRRDRATHTPWPAG